MDGRLSCLCTRQHRMQMCECRSVQGEGYKIMLWPLNVASPLSGHLLPLLCATMTSAASSLQPASLHYFTATSLILPATLLLAGLRAKWIMMVDGRSKYIICMLWNEQKGKRRAFFSLALTFCFIPCTGT